MHFSFLLFFKYIDYSYGFAKGNLRFSLFFNSNDFVKGTNGKLACTAIMNIWIDFLKVVVGGGDMLFGFCVLYRNYFNGCLDCSQKIL